MHIDKDNNGYIQSSELRSAMRNLGQNPTEQELQDMINEIDINGNGHIDFHEFVGIMKEMFRKEDENMEEEMKYVSFFIFNKNTFVVCYFVGVFFTFSFSVMIRKKIF